MKYKITMIVETKGESCLTVQDNLRRVKEEWMNPPAQIVYMTVKPFRKKQSK